jgi:hypothetical protein
MGEILSAVTGVITRVVDVMLMPFGSHRAAGLIVFSMLTGAALTLLYRALADETAIRRTRDVFKARVLEMRLYPDDLVLIFRALGGAIAAQGSYLRVAAKPILIAALIAVPLFIQVESRYARAPLAPGASTIVTVRLKPGLDVLTVPSGLAYASVTMVMNNEMRDQMRSVRAPAAREVSWRIKAPAGRRPLDLEVYGQNYRFGLCAQSDNRAIGHERHARSIMGGLTEIGLPPIGKDSPLEAVSIAYPTASYSVFGARMSWLVVFALGTLVGASIPAMLLRVAL